MAARGDAVAAATRIEVVTNEAWMGRATFTVTVAGRPVATFGSQRAAIAHSAILMMRQQARDRRCD